MPEGQGQQAPVLRAFFDHKPERMGDGLPCVLRRCFHANRPLYFNWEILDVTFWNAPLIFVENMV